MFAVIEGKVISRTELRKKRLIDAAVIVARNLVCINIGIVSKNVAKSKGGKRAAAVATFVCKNRRTNSISGCCVLL